MCPPLSADDGPALPRVAGGLLAGAVALSGCTSSADEVRAGAVGSRGHVLAESRAMLAGLAALGSFGRPPRGAWSGCADLGGRVEFHVTGRLDPAPALPGPLVDRVRDRLAAAGVRLRVVGVDADPVTLRGTRGEVRVQVTGYPTRPMVLLDLAGPCLDVGDLDDELLDEPATRLGLGEEAS